jgi:hypothetical protein
MPARAGLVEHCAEIAQSKQPPHITFSKMIGVAQRRPADLLAGDFPARKRWRHARNPSHSSSESNAYPWLSTTLLFCMIGT